MTKSEFLEKLRAALGNDLTGSIIQENVNYYDQYISEEVSRGRAEEEVIRELGDPWVLAQTIIDTAGSAGPSKGDYACDTQGQHTYRSQDRENAQMSFWSLGGWKLILVLLGIIGILLIIVSVIGGILSFFAPVLIPLLIIVFIFRIFRRNQ